MKQSFILLIMLMLLHSIAAHKNPECSWAKYLKCKKKEYWDKKGKCGMKSLREVCDKEKDPEEECCSGNCAKYQPPKNTYFHSYTCQEKKKE